MNLQHPGCWNHLEKLAEMFLNTFHREHILQKLKLKKLLRKIKSKNLTAGVFFFFNEFFLLDWCNKLGTVLCIIQGVTFSLKSILS